VIGHFNFAGQWMKRGLLHQATQSTCRQKHQNISPQFSVKTNDFPGPGVAATCSNTDPAESYCIRVPAAEVTPIMKQSCNVWMLHFLQQFRFTFDIV